MPGNDHPWGTRTGPDRRTALKASALMACMATLAVSSRGHAAPAAKETGLSYEGLLKGVSGFQPRTQAPLPTAEIPGFLSRAQLARSYAVYSDAFKDLLDAEQALRSASRDPGDIGDYGKLRARQVASANAVLLHEFYFRNLAANSVDPSRYVRSNMTEHMGTLESWREDFAACARAAEAWAVLVYDPYDDRWHNLPLGVMDAGGMVGTNPLVVCNVAEEAWSTDYDSREPYIEAFFRHIDWDEVASRYHAVDRK